MKRTFSSEDRDEVKLVKVKAIKRGTVSGKFGNFHMDPKGKDPLARARSVRPEVADELVKKGLAVRVGNGSSRTSGYVAERLIDTVAARRRETSITRNDEETRMAEVFGSNGADTRDTTAFEVDPSKSARVSPFEAPTLTTKPADGEEEDEDDTDEDNDDGDDYDQGEGETGRAHLSLNPADDAMAQEGNAGGGDAPPIDSEDAHQDEALREQAGSDQGAGESRHDDTGASTDGTATTRTGADLTTEDAAPAVAAPKPRRSRSTPAA